MNKKYTDTHSRNHAKPKNTLLGFKKKDYLKQVSQITQHSTIKQNLTQQTNEWNIVAKVAIMGRPNVGKSSLFNRLNQKNIAITSHISGSTRDINKQNIHLQHFDICLIDTGGLEVSHQKLKDFTSQNTKKPIQNPRKQDSINLTYQSHNHDIEHTQDSKNSKRFNHSIESVRDSKPIDIHQQNHSNIRQQAQIAQSLKESISLHSYQVVADSDIILYMVDGRSIANDEDMRIFRELSKQKPTILVLNKVDNDKIALDLSEFMSFGVDFLVLSVSHNRGITKLLSKLESTIQSLIEQNKLIIPKIQNLQPLELDFIDYFEDDNESIVEFQALDSKDCNTQVAQAINETQHCNIAVGIIGRPNVGKSSLLNALTKQNRSLVSSIAGTTIDPVNESIVYKGHTITFIDTAGIRRRSKIEGIEKYALDRTQRILKDCDIALLVLDSSTDFVELDEKISSIASNNELGIIVVFNKWDIRCKEFDEQMQIYKRKFKFLEYAPTITLSSVTLKHINELKQKILEVYQYFSFRIPTAKLNTCIQNALKKHPIPSDHGKLVKIYYATQFDTKPPKIALVMNKPNALHFSYKRYLVNILRQEFQFIGTPIIIESRNKKQTTDEM